MTDEEKAWHAFIGAAHNWATQYMDQYEKVKFQVGDRTIYLTLTYNGGSHRHLFETVDHNGQALPLGPHIRNSL